MKEGNQYTASRPPRWILLWFGLDAIVGLAPPLHWAVSEQRAPILGLPIVVFYFIACGIFVAASIVAASWAEAAREGKDR